MNKTEQGNKTKLDFQIPPLAKPLRIIQLIVLLTLFSFIVYMTNLIFRHEKVTLTITIIFSILLLVLTTVYVFVLAVDIINQFDKNGPSDTPMAGFSFVGFLLFAITSIIIIFYMIQHDSSWVIILILCLSILSAILFLVDLILCFSYWRETYLKKSKCYPQFAEENDYLDSDNLYISKAPRIRKTQRCDLSASESNINQSVEYEDNKNDQICKKVARRREYADFSENTPSFTAVECVQVQTEPAKIFVAESQTHKLEVKEAPVQTLYQPEHYLRTDLPSCVFPATNSICPAVLQLMRGGMASQYLRICKCEQGAAQHEQQQQHLQLQLLQSTNRETSLESFLDQNKGADKETCLCPTFEIDLLLQTPSIRKTVSKLSMNSCSLKNNKTQTFFNGETREELKNGELDVSKKETEMKKSRDNKRNSEKEIGERKKVDKEKQNFIHRGFSDSSDKKDSFIKNENLVEKISPKVSEVNSISITNDSKSLKNDKTSIKSVDLFHNMSKGDLEFSDKNYSQNDKSFAEKVIELSQEAINQAEETLSAPGSYNKQCEIVEDSIHPTASYTKLSSSIPNSAIFQRKNKIEPIDFTKFNNLSNSSAREAVLKLRLPLENSTAENRTNNNLREINDQRTRKYSEKSALTNRDEKRFLKSDEKCSCVAQKRKQDLCTIQVQYIFQNRLGKIVCAMCATPESIRIPQKLACSAKNCVKCYQCYKVLSPPCKCHACDKK